MGYFQTRDEHPGISHVFWQALFDVPIKTYSLVKPRTSTAGHPWSWVDVLDSERGTLLRMTAFGAQVKKLLGLKLLETYEFVSFTCERVHGGGI